MATPGYDGQVVGRDCDCEDFPCCGHGITAADITSYRELWDRGGLFIMEDEDAEMPDNKDLCPICGEHITLTGKTKDGRLIGSCNDAFTEEQWNNNE